MEKIKHQDLVTDNGLQYGWFSENLRKKVNLFSKLHSRLEKAKGTTQAALNDQLKELDEEIYDGMLAEIDDWPRKKKNSVAHKGKEVITEEKVENQKRQTSTPEPTPKKPKKALKNNDRVKVIGGHRKYIGVVAKIIAVDNTNNQVTISATEIPDGKTLYNKENVVRANDEDILEELHKMKHTKKIKRSFLHKCGLQNPLTKKQTIIGDYVLTRTSAFMYIFALTKLIKT